MSHRAGRGRVPSRGPRRRAMLREVIGADTDVATELLAAAREQRAAALDLQTGLLVTASRWALAHLVDESLVDALPGREGAAQVAGDGAPLVAEFCIAELAAALGMSTDAGRHLLSDAVELAHRLPLTWTTLLSGRLTHWRARRLASLTVHLSPEAAAHLDEQVHGRLETLGLAALEALVTETIALFDPERAAADAAEAAKHRHVRIDPPFTRTLDGLADLGGRLDATDAQDLDTRLADLAHQLLALHPDESLDVRRARALGYLARGQEVPTPDASPAPRAERQAVVHLHLTDPHDNPFVRVDEGRFLVDAARVRDWLDVPRARVVVKPVIDLRAPLASAGYEVPDRVRDLVVLRDTTCVFPWCTRNARGCDVDHVVPYQDGGETHTDNLAALCRRHHRLKTHGGWTYARDPDRPDVYHWTSRHGLRFTRGPTGSHDRS